MLCLASKAQRSGWKPFSKMPPLKYFVQPQLGTGMIGSDRAYMLGFSGAVSWDKKNAAGITFHSSINKFTPSLESDQSVFLKNVLTGAFYEYSLLSDYKFKVLLLPSFGVGELYYDFKVLQNSSMSFPYNEQYYFYTNPGVGIEYSLAPRWRAVGGASYLWSISDVKYRTVKSADINRPYFWLGIKFGKFFNP